MLKTVPSCPTAGWLGEEINLHLATNSIQVVVGLIGLLLQSLHQTRCPSLDALQHLNTLSKLSGPKLDTALDMWPHQCPVQVQNHFPGPAGHTIADTGQDAIGLLCHLGTLLAHVELSAYQNPQIDFCLATIQPPSPLPVALHGVVVAKGQDPTLGLVELHTLGFSPFIQLVQIPLQSPPTLQQSNTPPQLGAICKFANGRLNPLIQIINKDIKQDWTQH
ncbi:hypothetical protein WISP_70074 [Willisornis vidua]|uniref:Uncharacterized protein n=1 Tax=Willisornis vidua TaxID=1566151 RepID=A0ABQ9D7S7_9PASS|nr:hypothetical protein WISP_70074 [Willisornis vidua]